VGLYVAIVHVLDATSNEGVVGDVHSITNQVLIACVIVTEISATATTTSLIGKGIVDRSTVVVVEVVVVVIVVIIVVVVVVAALIIKVTHCMCVCVSFLPVFFTLELRYK